MLHFYTSNLCNVEVGNQFYITLRMISNLASPDSRYYLYLTDAKSTTYSTFLVVESVKIVVNSYKALISITHTQGALTFSIYLHGRVYKVQPIKPETRGKTPSLFDKSTGFFHVHYYTSRNQSVKFHL